MWLADIMKKWPEIMPVVETLNYFTYPNIIGGVQKFHFVADKRTGILLTEGMSKIVMAMMMVGRSGECERQIK